MPKPRGTTGATKMKILAVVCHNGECGTDSYGYNIWQALKGNFHMYLNDEDVRNVYHHLKELHALGMLERKEDPNGGLSRFLYRLTEKGQSLRPRFNPYIEVVLRDST